MILKSRNDAINMFLLIGLMFIIGILGLIVILLVEG